MEGEERNKWKANMAENMNVLRDDNINFLPP